MRERRAAKEKDQWCWTGTDFHSARSAILSQTSNLKVTSTKGTSSGDAKGHHALEATSGRSTMDKLHTVTKTLCTKDTRQGSFVSRTSTAQDAVKATNASTVIVGSGMRPYQRTKKDATRVDSKERKGFHHIEAIIVTPQEEGLNSKAYKEELKIGWLRNSH